MKVFGFSLFSFFFICLLSSCIGKEGYRFEEGVVWNTLYHITYESDKDLSDSILKIFNDIDSSLSPFNEESIVSKINSNRSNKVDGHFINVFTESLKIHHQSDGAFDPTLAPAIRAWGFGQGHEVSADTLHLDSLLQIVGIEKTRLDGTELIKEDKKIEFNFSALAKGYGVDCVAEMLKNNGVKNFLVEIGGEIRASGSNKHGNPWAIGIDRPQAGAPNGETVMTLHLSDGALATSGNYRNFHVNEGKRFGHTLSPFTCRPIETDVISATVISSDCMEADALATCCMVLGCEKALDLCTRLRAAVMLIKPDLTIVTNPAFDAYCNSGN